jgi:hypothetical protein
MECAIVTVYRLVFSHHSADRSDLVQGVGVEHGRIPRIVATESTKNHVIHYDVTKKITGHANKKTKIDDGEGSLRCDNAREEEGRGGRGCSVARRQAGQRSVPASRRSWVRAAAQRSTKCSTRRRRRTRRSRSRRTTWPAAACSRWRWTYCSGCTSVSSSPPSCTRASARATTTWP